MKNLVKTIGEKLSSIVREELKNRTDLYETCPNMPEAFYYEEVLTYGPPGLASLIKKKVVFGEGEQGIIDNLLATPSGKTSVELAYDYLMQVSPVDSEPVYRYQDEAHTSVLRFMCRDGVFYPWLLVRNPELSGIEIPYSFNDMMFFILFVDDYESLGCAHLEQMEAVAKKNVKEAAVKVLQAPSDDEAAKATILKEATEAKLLLNSLYFS